MKAFLVAVVLHPTKKEADEGAQSKVIVPLQFVLAENDQAATLQVSPFIPAEHQELVGSSRVEVFARPFT